MRSLQRWRIASAMAVAACPPRSIRTVPASISSWPRRRMFTAICAAGTTTRTRRTRSAGSTRVGDDRRLAEKVVADAPVLVDAGDILQGNPLTYAAARIDTTIAHPVILAMNAMQYDAAAIGNHEFNYGLPTLDRAMREADFPFLAAKYIRPDGAPRFAAWAVSTRRGIKIAIVGATTPGSMLWDRDNLAGRIVMRDIVPNVRAAVRDARAAGAGVDHRRRPLRSERAVQLRHGDDQRAERKRRGAARARSAGDRPHRVRSFAQGDGGYGDWYDAADAAKELGDERRHRAPHGRSAGTDTGTSRRSTASSCRRCITTRTRRSLAVTARGTEPRCVCTYARSAPRRSRGAPTRRVSSTRRSSISFSTSSARPPARSSPPRRRSRSTRRWPPGRSPSRGSPRSIRTTTPCAR